MQADEAGQLILTEEEKNVLRSGLNGPLYRLLEGTFAHKAVDAQGQLVTFNGTALTPFEAGRRIGLLQAEAMMFQRVTDSLKDQAKELSEGDDEKIEDDDDMSHLL